MPWSRSRPPPSERGTGHEHRKARAAAALHHDPSHLCCRCGRALGPMGPWLHYDHNRDRTGYLGFAHARCNVSAGAVEGRRRQTVTARRL